MQLSTKARYAARAMIELANHYPKGFLQLKEVARRQNISDKYLEQIMTVLRSGGFIVTRKGSRGGHSLAKDPKEISLYDIVHAVEGSLAPVNCVDNSSACKRVNICAAHELWVNLKDTITRELSAVTLDQMAAAQKKKDRQQTGDNMYYI